MNVLYVLHTSRMDGSTISFLSMVEGLMGKGVDVVVAGPELQPKLKKKLDALDIRYYEIRLAENLYPKIDIKYPLRVLNLLRRKRNSARDLLYIALRYKPDIIHTNSGVIIEGYKVANKLNIPHVWHLREYQEKDFNWNIFPSKSVFITKLKQSHVISITDDIRCFFELKDYSRARTIYNGVCRLDSISGVSTKERVLLCASRISKEKGFDDLITVFASFNVKYPDYRLVILGEGDKQYIESLRNKAKALGCSSAIDWLGYKSNVMPYMQRATALIVASHFEGFGRMTAEACFAGCLVVGRNSGGTKEILSETGGYLFDDNQGFLKALNDVVSLSKEEYKKKALFAQKKAQELYSIEGNVEKIYNFYQKILSDKHEG